MSMLQSRKSGAYCYCCNESLVPVGIARAREEREWRRDYLRGEVGGTHGDGLAKGQTVHHITYTVEPDGNWWLVTIPEYDIVGQAEHRSEAANVARSIAALWLDADEQNITVDTSTA